MTKGLSILTFFKIFLFLSISIILLFIFTEKKIKAYEFNIYSGNVGVGGSAPSDTVAPTVSITNPTNGSTVSGVVLYSADATDDVGVTNVEFLVDGGLVGTDTSAPYSTLWDTTVYANNTVHSLLARAFDAAGNVGTSQSYSVTVLDITAPSVNITNPLNGSIVQRGTTVTINANASDASGIQKVEFRVNGILKCTDTIAAYSCNWSVPAPKNKPYALEAKAFDNAGLTATHTINVTSSN